MSALFSGGVEDTSVSCGYVKEFEKSEDPVSILTPYFCAYRFETNEYKVSAVNGKISYAIDYGIFKELYDNRLYCSSSKDTITDYNIYLIMRNTETAIVRDLSYAQRLKGYDAGTVQNGVYIHEKFEFNDLNSFPFDNCSLSSYLDKKEQLVRRDFTHTEEVTVPEELFAGNKGCIDIRLTECIIFDSGKIEYLDNCGSTYLYYLKEGNQVKLSRTKFK